MLAKILTSSVLGIEGVLVEVEADVSSGGLPYLDIVGLPSEEIRESKFRVRSALRNSGFVVPINRMTVNLAPANIKKVGSGFDLPIAVGLAAASGQVPIEAASRFLMMGELSLDGEVRPVRGALCMVSVSAGRKLDCVIVPATNAQESSICTDVPVYGMATLAEVFGFLRGNFEPERARVEVGEFTTPSVDGVDFGEVRGQEHARRAVEVAVSGAHNILLIGPPGSGKTMIARRIPTILPPMSVDEAVETTKIFSVAGHLEEDGLLMERPFRSPHHTVSDAALIGGGSIPRPGEVSLAHHGVLFLDEFTEFRRSAIEVLRQPLEDGTVTIARAQATVTFPADFMLVAAMNPCPCGHLTDPRKACKCSARDIDRYRRKVSGPLLDRIDIHIEVPPTKYSDISGLETGEASETLRQRVTRARAVQSERFERSLRVFTNAQMSARDLSAHCKLDTQSDELLRSACTRLGLSARSYTKILKVARTIADLDGAESIEARHLAEAIQYRSHELG